MSKFTRRRRFATTYTGGIEGTLDGVAWALLLLGLAGALIWMIVAAAIGPAGFINGLFCAFSAFVTWLLFRSLAEIIRLLKKQAGLHFGGKITEAEERVVYACAECGARLYDDYHCHSCGRTIESGSNIDRDDNSAQD